MPVGVGSWSAPQSTPVFAVHGALTYNPDNHRWKVLLFAGGEEANDPPVGTPNDLRKSALWDPTTNAFTEQPFTILSPDDKADPFCAHQCQLPDGRILVMGGSFYGGPDGRGVRAAWIFDPRTEAWTRTSDMQYGRWYPTSVVLPDGRVLVASGRDENGSVVPQMEVFDPTAETWTTLPSSASKPLDIYPSLHLVPAGPHAGKVLYTGTRWSGGGGTWSPPATSLFDPSAHAWTDLATHLVRNRTEGFSVLLPPAQCARYLVLGGGADASDGNADSAEWIDMMESTPQWRRVQDMHDQRTNVNGVLLPNGTVFVLGGHDTYKWNAQGATDRHIYDCEIYDPSNKGWIHAARMADPRQYHSFALLLPDGRVFSAGGVNGNTGDVMTMELYSPPYLEDPNRPGITGSPGAVTYAQTFAIDTPQSASIDRAVLIRPMAITHHTDSEQRLVDLPILSRGPGSIQVSVPGTPVLAPPGYYMLFLVNACGIPSEAVFLHVGQPFKPAIKEVKEGKEIKEKEFKEFKEKPEKQEYKEIKELKEFDEKIMIKDKPEKELVEDWGLIDPRVLPVDRLRRAGTLEHFIGPELRPDLTRGALKQETDLRAHVHAEAVIAPDKPDNPRGTAYKEPAPERKTRAKTTKAEAKTTADAKTKGRTPTRRKK